MPQDNLLNDGVAVKVSAASMRLKFMPCVPEYITTRCNGRCCQSAQYGHLIAASPDERAALTEAFGWQWEGGFLVCEGKACPAKQENGLCGIHYSGIKPISCWAAPFMLNTSGTLVIRNRHKMLVCYKDEGGEPVYQCRRDSLEMLFGKEETDRMCMLLDAGAGDFTAYMLRAAYDTITYVDDLRRKARKAGSREAVGSVDV